LREETGEAFSPSKPAYSNSRDFHPFSTGGAPCKIATHVGKYALPRRAEFFFETGAPRYSLYDCGVIDGAGPDPI